jgi:hypothetical protein
MSDWDGPKINVTVILEWNKETRSRYSDTSTDYSFKKNNFSLKKN